MNKYNKKLYREQKNILSSSLFRLSVKKNKSDKDKNKILFFKNRLDEITKTMEKK